MFKKFLSWLIVILWLGVIYYFSAQPNLASGFQPFWDIFFRKIAHIAEYFVLTYLFFSALKQYNLPFRKILIWTIIFSFLVAILDEYHQTFILGRQAKVLDVLIDGIGIISAAFLLKLKQNYYTI